MARATIDRPRQERRLRMSFEEFLAWADEDVHAEWVNGEVIVFVPASERHQDLVGFLYSLLSHYVHFFDLGKVMLAPFEMRLLPAVRASREPDLLFVSRERLDRLSTGRRVDGPADLVVEIVSEHSTVRDRRDKFAEYEAAGVPEYWLVDGREGSQRPNFYRLGPHGGFEELDPDADGRIRSTVVSGFWLRSDWLSQDPLPDPLVLLATEIAPEILTALTAARPNARWSDGRE